MNDKSPNIRQFFWFGIIILALALVLNIIVNYPSVDPHKIHRMHPELDIIDRDK